MRPALWKEKGWRHPNRLKEFDRNAHTDEGVRSAMSRFFCHCMSPAINALVKFPSAPANMGIAGTHLEDSVV